eukprot:SAG22_NODE_2553_length_2452_cov_7.185295_1_plen_575_part_10
MNKKCRLRHVGTGMYLKLDPTNNETPVFLEHASLVDPEKPELGYHNDQHMVFSVSPRLKSHTTLEIKENAQCKIFDVTGRQLLTIFSDKPGSERAIRAAAEDLMVPGMLPGVFRLQVFRKYSKVRLNSLSIGQTIKIFHSESEGYLMACGNADDQSLVVDTSHSKRDHSRHLFHVVNPDLDRRAYGGYVRTGDLFRLYNFASNRFLALAADTHFGRSRSSYKLVDRSESQMAESHFMLQEHNVLPGKPTEIGRFYMILSVRHPFVEAMELLVTLRAAISATGPGQIDAAELKQLATGNDNENRVYYTKFAVVVDTLLKRAQKLAPEDASRLSNQKQLLWTAILASLAHTEEQEFLMVGTFVKLCLGHAQLGWPQDGFEQGFAADYVPGELQMQVKEDHYVECQMRDQGMEARPVYDRKTPMQLIEAVRSDSDSRSDYDVFRLELVDSRSVQDVALVSSMVFYIDQMSHTARRAGVEDLTNTITAEHFHQHLHNAGAAPAQGDGRNRKFSHAVRRRMSVSAAGGLAPESPSGEVAGLVVSTWKASDSARTVVHDHFEKTLVALARLLEFCDIDVTR